MDSFTKFETEIYPKIWHLAYDAGVTARKSDLPRVCNLTGDPFCHGKSILKVYKSAWEQGWDGYTYPEEFKQVEEHLSALPLIKFDGVL